jgi:hypothetical protein
MRLQRQLRRQPRRKYRPRPQNQLRPTQALSKPERSVVCINSSTNECITPSHQELTQQGTLTTCLSRPLPEQFMHKVHGGTISSEVARNLAARASRTNPKLIDSRTELGAAGNWMHRTHTSTKINLLSMVLLSLSVPERLTH